MSAARPPEDPVYEAYLEARKKPLVPLLIAFIVENNDAAFVDFIYLWNQGCHSDEQAVKDLVLRLEKQFNMNEEKNELEPRQITVLAYAYEKGIGVEKNLRNAFELYSTVQDKDSCAQTLLGLMYQHGKYVEEKVETARRYFELAYKNKNGTAAACLYYLERDTTGKHDLIFLKAAADEFNLYALSEFACSEVGKKPPPTSIKPEIELSSIAAKRGYSDGLVIYAVLQHRELLLRHAPDSPLVKKALNFIFLCNKTKHHSINIINTYLADLYFTEKADLAEIDSANAAQNYRTVLKNCSSGKTEATKKANDRIISRLKAILTSIDSNQRLTPTQITTLFHAAYALNDKITVNAIAQEPTFIDLAKSEDWSEISSLLTVENAKRVREAILKSRNQFRDLTEDFLPSNVSDVVMQYALGINQSYFQASSVRFFSKAHESAVLLQQQRGKNLTAVQAAKLKEIIELETTKASIKKRGKV